MMGSSLFTAGFISGVFIGFIVLLMAVSPYITESYKDVRNKSTDQTIHD